MPTQQKLNGPCPKTEAVCEKTLASTFRGTLAGGTSRISLRMCNLHNAATVNILLHSSKIRPTQSATLSQPHRVRPLQRALQQLSQRSGNDFRVSHAASAIRANSSRIAGSAARRSSSLGVMGAIRDLEHKCRVAALVCLEVGGLWLPFWRAALPHRR